MKKYYLLIVVLLLIQSVFGQLKYITKTGEINFEASVPSFEEVKAINNTVTAILNLKTGEFAALALVKGFRFKVALMEEHFNENYAESSKFPKATFKGNLENFDFESLDKNPTEFKLIGTLNFHGKIVKISPSVFIINDKNNIRLTSSFTLKPEEFDIKIPKLIRKKVAETVDVTINFVLKPKS